MDSLIFFAVVALGVALAVGVVVQGALRSGREVELILRGIADKADVDIREFKRGRLQGKVDAHVVEFNMTMSSDGTATRALNLEATVFNAELPAWFKFSMAEGGWSLELYDHMLTGLKGDMLSHLMPESTRERLVSFEGLVTLKRGRSNTSLHLGVDEDDVGRRLVGHGARFVRVVKALERALPEHPFALIDALLGCSRDPATLSALYTIVTTHMSQEPIPSHALHQALAHHISPELVVTLIVMHSDIWETLELTQVCVDRAVDVLSAARASKALKPEARSRITDAMLKRISLEELTSTRVSRSPWCALPVLERHWRQTSHPKPVLSLADTLLPLMPGEDAARWLKGVALDMPSECTAARAHMVCARPMPPASRGLIVDAMLHVLHYIRVCSTRTRGLNS